MRLRRCKTIVAAIILTLLAAGCAMGGPLKKPVSPPGGTKPTQPDSRQADTGKVPWEKDTRFIKAKTETKTPVLIASYQATLPDPILYERHNISLAADYLAGAVVQPGEIFSLNGRIGWRSAQRGFKLGPMYSGGRIVSTVGGGVCKIASVLYNVTVLANQEVVERHAHSMTVPYVPPGQDATISYGTKDFKFKNISKGPILIWAKNTGGTLYMAFYGVTKGPKITWQHKTLSETKTWTEKNYDWSLPQGTEKVLVSGSKGITVHSWITIDNGTKKETKDMGISRYRPCPKIIAIGQGAAKKP